jgi:hypothetical protein
MDYLNFAIEVIAQPDGLYAISVVSSPVGEARVVVPNPLVAQEIERMLAVLGRRERVTKLEENGIARDIGEKLFNFLIRSNDDINAAYFASLDRANHQGLRIRLSVERAGALADLPWELLRDPNRDFLTLSRSTPIVRYTQMLSVRPPAEVAMPLRVLVMISAPEDFPKLDVEDEWRRLNEATAPLQQSGVLRLEKLETATLIALQRRLRTGEYHIFHFIGHSDFDPHNQRGVLVLEDDADNRRANLVTGLMLARELGEESTIRLVVLNSCQSARRAEKDPHAGIASSIVTRGIPAVAAMQFPISDTAARVFSEEFYRAIAENLPIDSAVSEARRAIANRLQNAEWATPALYMRSENGVLFRPAKAATGTTKAVSKPARSSAPTAWIAGVIGLVAVALILGVLLLNRPAGGGENPTPSQVTPSVEAPLPDLQISSISSAPARPGPGQVFRLLISIRNAGEGESGAFNWTWDASPVLRNALEGRIESIPPGASRNFSLVYSYGWWGSYSSQINIDADGEVGESDERNNRDAAIIELDPTRPFDIDFTFLPDNEIVAPPRLLQPGEFDLWNMTFALAAPADIDCAATLFAIVDTGQSNALQATDDTPAACAALPLAIVLRRPVSGAEVEVLSDSSGTATLTLYSDPDGIERAGQSADIPLSPGDSAEIAVVETGGSAVRRIEIATPDQPVRLLRLTLFPPLD